MDSLIEKPENELPLHFEPDLFAKAPKLKGFLKRNLKKAQKHKLTIVKNVKPEDIIDVFRENRGSQISNLSEDDYMKLRRLAYMGIYKGLVHNYGVYSPQNEL